MKTNKHRRLALLDSLRGATLISMILYHACWDAVYILGMNWPWYLSRGSYIWQQSICWTFILLSGFCVPFSKNLLKRGLQVFAAGAVVTLVTCLVLYEDRVVFGVLTLIGSCMLLMVPVTRRIAENRSGQNMPEPDEAENRSGQNIPEPGKTESRSGEKKAGKRAAALLLLFAALFILFRDVNAGVIGTGLLHRVFPLIPLVTIPMPDALYRNLFTAYLGFPGPDFFSTDYFSLLPWTFLYLCGYELHGICKSAGILEHPLLRIEIKPLAFMGRHSLLIYMLHQPVLYALVLLYNSVAR